MLAFNDSASAELLDKSKFSIVVNGDANLGSGVHVHGGAYIGGDLTYRGANGSYGSDMNNGDIGLYVNGSVNATQRLDLMNKDYYISGDLNSPMQNGGNEVSEAENGNVFFEQFSNMSKSMSSLLDTGVKIDSGDLNKISFELEPDQLNVVNLNSLSASYLSAQNANLMFSNFTENTFLVINYQFQDEMTMTAKNQNLPSYAYENIVWNLVGDGNVIIDSSVSTFKGSILAPDANVIWNANDIDGQLVSNTLEWNQTSQSHYYSPWENWDSFNIGLPDENFKDVGSPTGVSFLFLVGAILLFFTTAATSRGNKTPLQTEH